MFMSGANEFGSGHVGICTEPTQPPCITVGSALRQVATQFQSQSGYAGAPPPNRELDAQTTYPSKRLFMQQFNARVPWSSVDSLRRPRLRIVQHEYMSAVPACKVR